ncbi:hypothetical protein [Streptomyces sp. NPDC097619]|uniref:hypothetical protein n=1 Tax=Streptomyces sp. NPDC097619 TaxID=3157228 RepID=UPI00332BCDEC
MRSTLVRRSVMTASALSLALLATACGSDGGKEDAKGADKPAEKSASSAPAAKGKTDAELTPLLVTQADLKDHKVDSESAAALGASTSTADKTECTILAQVHGGEKYGAPTGVARTSVVPVPKQPAADASPEDKLKAAMDALGGTVTAIGLNSYDGKGAEEFAAAVKKAGTDCAAGFTVTSDGEKTKISSVKPAPAPAGGDETLGLVLTMDVEGTPTPMLLNLVRTGNTVATFSSLSLSGKSQAPTTVIETQLKKLG